MKEATATGHAREKPKINLKVACTAFVTFKMVMSSGNTWNPPAAVVFAPEASVRSCATALLKDCWAATNRVTAIARQRARGLMQMAQCSYSPQTARQISERAATKPSLTTLIQPPTKSQHERVKGTCCIERRDLNSYSLRNCP